MSVDFLKPINENVLEVLETFPKQVIGNKINKHTEKNGMPELMGNRVAIIGLFEEEHIDEFRKEFYQLYAGNWDLNILDLGNLLSGESSKDTNIAIQEISFQLRQINIIPIFIGGEQSITYPLFCSYEKNEQLVNITCIDYKFDLSTDEKLISSDSYIKSIIDYTPQFLNNLTNIGYQSYFVSNEERDMMDKLHFDYYRLGEVLDDTSNTEPIFRDTDLLSIDIQSVSLPSIDTVVSPNGFDARTICRLARYAGISDKISSVGIFNIYNNTYFYKLLAQIIWYFIEGVEYRYNEYPIIINECLRFTLNINDSEIVFYNSKLTDRWWMEINNAKKEPVLVSCTHNDYLSFCGNKIPERFLKRLNT